MQNDYPRFISRLGATVRVLFFAHFTKSSFSAACSAATSKAPKERALAPGRRNRDDILEMT
jgi:hypothetical protein